MGGFHLLGEIPLDKCSLEMMRETEKAINIRIAVQRRCEEIYVSAPETEITVLTVQEGDLER